MSVSILAQAGSIQEQMGCCCCWTTMARARHVYCRKGQFSFSDEPPSPPSEESPSLSLTAMSTQSSLCHSNPEFPEFSVAEAESEAESESGSSSPEPKAKAAKSKPKATAAKSKPKAKAKLADKGKGKGHKGKRNINVIMVPSKSSQLAKFSINFDPLHTIAFVKAEIEKLVGDSGMDLSFHRIPLEDMHTLDHYAIGNWSNVRLRWNAQGGHSRVDMEMAALGLSYADE
jgi:hypothetical protein